MIVGFAEGIKTRNKFQNSSFKTEVPLQVLQRAFLPGSPKRTPQMSTGLRRYNDLKVGEAACSYRDTITAYTSSQADLDSAVRALTGPTNDVYTSSNDEIATLVEALWVEIFDAVERAPGSEYMSGASSEQNVGYLSRLVDLLDAIRQSPAPPEPAGPKTTKDKYPIGAESCLWNDLPGFGAEARARWNVDPSLPSTDQARNSWTNLNSFIALLWSRYQVNQTPQSFDFALYAIWTLRQTLEEVEDRKVLSGFVPAAAAWMCFDSSAEKIWQSCQQKRSWPPENKRAPAKTGPMWEQAGKEREDGFSRERWHFWKGRFVQISGMNGMSDKMRKIALVASQRMGEVVGRS